VIVTLPPATTHLAAISLTGWTRRAGDGGPVLRGALVLKGRFSLDAPAGDPGAPLVATPAAAPELVLADRGSVVTGGYDLVYEADIALEKEHADVVVQGWRSTVGGCVGIAGANWLSRPADTALTADPDTARNLFGWLSRTHPDRAVPVVPKVPLPDAYRPRFNHFSRNGAGFTRPATTAQLPAGATVTVSRTPCGTPDPSPFTFRLPASLAHTARLRAYCGHGPDKAPRWRIVGEVALIPDSLIVAPAERAATVLWRASWRHDLVPDEQWRAVDVLAGGN
jgi:hypothetical protein